MKLLGIIAVLVALSGCDQQEAAPPVGRYQMVATNNERHDVFVLDTQNGDIWVCDSDAPLSVGCGPPKGRPH